MNWYRTLSVRHTRDFAFGGCMHSIRKWVYSNNHHSSRGTLGYLTACAGSAGHEGQHKTPDGYSW